ncbi:outer membrane protein assembly factor BamC [Gammaproteobacteria bacterium]|jgi:outer membrane protein assembly factor BamC|nr:outer membrane protein assembly factor BamC [Gammaproteobacteria bacterium]MDA7844872.1 outer membrane protein assembly factor BamC [Gammaproteobacteria bacterium]MDA9102605.1 outer membrane protein assembly factor BamC [Gammaproteobacteria bacterium]|tara:strand:- start:745 stop:1731 length:987 start_codon:yes stop_codon:yes gene_type:complete
MIKKLMILWSIGAILFISSCSYISGPEGMFPTTEYDFLNENVESNISLPENLDPVNSENHYPVSKPNEIKNDQDVPKPRQIFASSGNSSVQLRRLGELMWIYIETLPSTSWPISKSYWDTSSFQILSSDANTGEIVIDYDQSSILKMTIEHGIKEASTEIFLTQVSKDSNELVSNVELIQSELENVVNYFAESIDSFSGTSLAAQNLNEKKKAKIFTENGQTVIELDLSFNRAWSSVSKALSAANIISNDRDRSKGVLYVSYVKEKEGGFLSFIGLGNNNAEIAFTEEAQFEINIVEENNKSYVKAISKNGKIDDAEQLLSRINEALN